MTLADLRNNAVGPHLFTDCVRDGVLRDIGLAAQEMPGTCEGGALTGYLHNTDPTTEHAAFIRPEFRDLPVVFRGADLTALRQALIVDGAMSLADLTSVYGAFPSLALQQVGFSPQMATPGDAPANYDYGPVLTDMIAAWPGRPMFVNCGDANNWQFPTGSFHFNNAYPLRCHPDRNPLRGQTLAADFSVEATGWVIGNSQICADNVARTWGKMIYDPTHPDVAPLILDHCTDLADEFGTQLRYMCHGESAVIMWPNGGSPDGCGGGATLGNCSSCEPSTNMAAHMVAGFRNWLTSASGLNLTLDQINTRWGTAFSSLAQLDASVTTMCPSWFRAIADWRTFGSFLMNQLGWQEYRACKAADSAIKGTRFSFGTKGLEAANLGGEFAAVGDYYAETSAVYASQREYGLRHIANSGLLSGVPPHFAITSPTFDVATSFTGQESIAPILRAVRNYTANQVNWLYRDVLTSGGAGIGYLFGTPNFSFGAHTPSRTAVLSTIGAAVTAHPYTFAGCGGHARVAVHVDIADADNWRGTSDFRSAGRTGYQIAKRLRDSHKACALFHSLDVLTRPHSRSALDSSITLVPFHSQRDTLATNYYLSRFPDNAPGAVVFVDVLATVDVPAYADPVPEFANAFGALHRCEPAGNPVNVWLYAVRPQRACENRADRYLQKVARFTLDSVVPWVAAQVADSRGAAFEIAPVNIATAGDVASNYVTDGINFTVALSNMGGTSADVTVTGSDEIAGALAVSYAPQAVTIAAGATQFVSLNATLSGIDVPAAIDDAQAKLALMGVGYADSVAQITGILTHAQSIEVSHPSRAAALYVSAIRAPLVQCTIAAGVATVTVQRLGIVGGPTSEAIEGARVLAVWPLNQREHGPSGTTNASGVAELTLGSPSATHWDFATQAFASPWAGTTARVEIQVTDPRTCASTRIEIANP